MEEPLSIINKTKIKLPSLPILLLKNEILGEKYSLSVAFVEKNISQKLNNTLRDKDHATNVLSFALDKNSGELILCPAVVKKETKKFSRNFTELLGFLVIHGMLHLKGMQHGAIMEKAEKKYDEKYFSRNRRGNIHDTSSRGRISKRRNNS